jgi:hypothetical protein
MDGYARRIFSEELKALGEPSLLEARDKESYRVMMEGNTMAGDSWELIAIRAQPRSIHTAAIERLPDEVTEAGYGHVVLGPLRCQTRKLSPSEWTAIRDCFETTSFWTARVGKPPWHSTDASSWIIESRSLERYHFVVRMGVSPAPGRQKEGFMECVRSLIDLSLDRAGL